MLAISNLFLGDLAIYHRYAASEDVVLLAGLFDAVLGNILYQRENVCAIALVGGRRNHCGDVGNTNMDDAVLDEVRIADGSILGGLDDAFTLQVNDDRTLTHAANHIAGHDGNFHAGIGIDAVDQHIGLSHFLGEGGLAHKAEIRVLQHRAQILQALNVYIEDDHFGAEALSSLCCAHTGMTAAENANASSSCAGNGNDGDTAAAVLTLQILATQQRSRTACNLAHGTGHCAGTVGITRGFDGDAGHASVSQDLDLLGLGSTFGHVESGFPGFSVGKHEEKLGLHGSPTAEIVFQDCIIPKENLLGQEGKGFKIAMGTLDGGRIGIAAQSLGIAEGALAEAVNYTKGRIQFGKPISKFQNTQFTLADMELGCEAGRLLTYQAAVAKGEGKRYTKLAAMAKLFTSEHAMKTTTKVVQLFGGYGYTKDYPVERMMRDAKITEIYEGTSEVQRIVISANMGL